MQSAKQDLTHLFVTPGRDWSSKAIIAALEQKGATLQGIENELGLGTGSLRNAFYRHVPGYECAIAQKIGISPDLIWPNRYQPDSRLSA